MHVLIADDSAAIRKNLIRLLTPVEGIRRISESGDISPTIDALEASDPPDVLILDMHMPEGTGIEVLSYVKENHKKVKIIVLTNYATEYYRKKTRDLGAEYFFDKSTEFEKVIPLLRSLNI